MKIKVFILFVITLLSGGCRRILLDKESKSLQPYKEEDVLVFQNTNGQTDTIIIKEIKSIVTPTDPLDVFPTRIETMYVNGKISVREIKNDILGNPIIKKHISLLKIKSSKKSDDFNFTFDNPNNDLTCPTISLAVNNLKNQLKANSGRIIIQVEEYLDNPSKEDNDLIAFEWDEDLGYTKFLYKKNLNLELVDFIRNGKSIMK